MKAVSLTSILAGACVITLFAGTGRSADPTPSDDMAPADQVFRPWELSVDAFGGLTLGEQVIKHISRERVTDNGRLGLGAGLNFFFDRHFGLAADAFTENTGHSFVDDASGSLVFRFPIDSIRLAPYIFAGGGYQFDPVSQAFVHGGAGLEYRFAPHAGVFLDARYVLTRHTDDFGLARLGFRFSF